MTLAVDLGSLMSNKHLMLYLTSAFDSVGHNILLNMLKFLAGFGSASKCSPTTASLIFGVPQGSILGPLSFSFYILSSASIIQPFDYISFHLYADDIKLYISFKLRQLDRLSTPVDCLSWISDWLSNNYLVLNSSKAETMIIAPPELHPKISQVSLMWVVVWRITLVCQCWFLLLDSAVFFL
uniref:Reverse transcriptase domain-containing protein n=1 Tax=Pundamilia nyererei TaxID=303518 RepID=A0A3B4FFL8_9CICH